MQMLGFLFVSHNLNRKVLTFLYAWGDGQQGHYETQATIDAQKHLVE